MKLIVCCLSVFSLIIIVQGQGRGAVRLFDNGDASTELTSGIVEVYYNNQFTSICNASVNSLTPITICRQLGYSYGETVSNSKFGPKTVPAISNVACGVSDLNILKCDFSQDVAGCTATNSLAVECSDTPLEFSGGVRLTGNNSFTGVGLVEVYCNGDWGLVCNTGFTSADADTVCRQLGYTKATNYGSSFGNGSPSQSVWFSSLNCGASDQCLSDCQQCPSTPVTDCSVSNVAGVECSYESGSSDYSGTYQFCLLASALKGLVGIIVGVVIAFIICVVVIILTPIIICCCLGVGIGAGVAAGSRRKNPKPYQTF